MDYGVKLGRKIEGNIQASYCMGCMQADCGTLVHQENGVVTNVEGNPDCPTNRGKICIRGITPIMGFYNPYRVKTPPTTDQSKKGAS